MAKKSSKYSRRNSVSIRRSDRIPVIIGICVFVALLFAAAIILGNILKSKADKYEQESDSEREPIPSVEVAHSNAPEVDAYHYNLGADAYSGYLNDGITDFSVCLRDADGSLAYRSELCEAVGWDVMESDYTIEKQTGYIHRVGGYFCGYFYVGSLNMDNDALRRVRMAYEISLIREAMSDGLDDIMLVGIDVNEANIGWVEDFLSEITSLDGNCRVGVMLSADLVKKTENNLFLASRVLAACDYIALDLTSVSSEQTEEGIPSQTEQTLDEMHYYIKAFGMRLVFDRADATGYKTASKMGYNNIQRVNSSAITAVVENN